MPILEMDTSGATIAHGLGVAPQMIIVKGICLQVKVGLLIILRQMEVDDPEDYC